MDNIEQFKQIVSEMTDTYKKKSSDYGNSFERTLDKWGANIGLARIDDKLNRASNILSTSCQHVNDESIEDTLKDLATYSIMLLMWVKKKSHLSMSNDKIDWSLRNDRNNIIETATIGNINKKDFEYLLYIKNWKLDGGINSNGFPTKTMYADVDKFEFIEGTDAIKIYFKNVRNTKNQIVGSGTYVGMYNISQLSEIGLGKD